MKTLKNRLAKDAQTAGICNEWYNMIRTCTNKHQLADIYIRGLEFCLKNHYPDKSIIKKHFGEIAHDYGVYVDEWLNLNNVKKIVALGKTSGTITCNGFNFGEINIADECDITIKLANNSITRLNVYDHANINIDIADTAKLWINLYTEDSRLHTNESGSPKIKIFYKTQKSN